jgi:uncharacterized protein (TIGR00156 family)
MKKALVVWSAVMCMLMIAPAMAQFKGPGSAGGYVGPGADNRGSSVAAILKNPVDDQRVTLRGNIIRHIGGDKYMFSDGTGEIRVDIDDHLFPVQPIDESTVVEIIGEVDTDFMQFSEIDVKSLRILQ